MIPYFNALFIQRPGMISGLMIYGHSITKEFNTFEKSFFYGHDLFNQLSMSINRNRSNLKASSK